MQKVRNKEIQMLHRMRALQILQDTKCEQRDNCKLMAVLKENRALKKKVSRLKHQLDESELKRSYMINPNAIGDRHDMGCW